MALDGDVDFRPEAVRLLVDRMKKNKKVGAACGRIHPIVSEIKLLIFLFRILLKISLKKGIGSNGLVSKVRVCDWSLASESS